MAESDDAVVQVENKINIGNWISRAWDMVTADLGAFLILGLIYVAIIAVTSSTVIGELFVIGPLTVGFFYVVFQKIRGAEINVGDIAKGFNFFIAAVLANILVGIFTAIGFVLCIIPGFIITALYVFTMPFILEKNYDFWQAMEASRKAVTPHLFEMIIFIILLALINLVGAIICGIGLIFTVPLTLAATAIAYQDLIGLEMPKK